ncbi:MAG: hypothetical protein IAE99_08280 [Rhodothermales bacterium]|nr:hypothetical protein [Rhodothermales bacterium]
MSTTFDNGFETFGATFKKAVLRMGARRVLAYVDVAVKRRTKAGDFLPGSSPSAGGYSEKPFARPAGGLKKKTLDALDDTDRGSSFFTRQGALWVVVEGGYKDLRQIEGKQNAHVDLLYSGALLDATRDNVRTGAATLEMEYGYLDGKSPADAARVAYWHQEAGAGKGKTKRVFIGLTPAEEKHLLGMLNEEARKALLGG